MMILSRLLVLVLVGMLPAISIQAYNEFDLRRARQIEVQNQAINLAKLAAEEQQQIVQGMHQVLIALSELPAIRAKKGDVCNEALVGLKSRFPAFLSFQITDTSGEPFCDTNIDRKPVNVSERAYFTEAMKTGAFTVGEYSIGLSIHRKVIQFVLPFYGDDGQIGGVIIAPLGLDWLADYVAHMSVPKGAALTVTDRNGTCLARYPDNDKCVGRKLSTPDGDPRSGKNTTADIVGIDGIERIVGFSTLGPDSGGLLVSFGLDKAQAFAEIQRRTQRGVLLITLSALIVLGLTLLGARQFIRRPLGLLVDAANEWRLGNYARRVVLRDKSEIAEVAASFNSMADALEHRERELSEAKEKAVDAANRIRMIFESTTDSVIIVDRDWRISFVNQRAWAQISEGRELVGMQLKDALIDAADTDILKRLGEAMSENLPLSFEAFCPARKRWFAINAFPSSEGLAIFFRDVTEHRRAVEQHRLIEEQLHQSQKMESVGQLTGGIAHDFNNLLAVVSGNLELIERAAPNDDVRQFAMIARRATDRGARLTAQLLAFSRRQRLNPKLVNANELITEFQGLIQQAVGEACEVKLRTDERLWLCHVDPQLLETALLNLALNGRDAMPDGGRFEIETRNVVLDEGSVTGCPAGAYVRLSVADTGEGMPPEVLDRVFEPFFTTKDVGKGTGLGLSMVYGFVRQSGGYVTIESTAGVGTTVALYLPKVRQEPAAGTEVDQSKNTPRGSERILVVEDNEDLLEVTSAMLTNFGYRALCARNGTEAIQILDSGEEFELLFSDIVLAGGVNGVELAREARRRNSEIKVLLTTGYADHVLTRQDAVNEFPIIQKPFRFAELAQCLRTVLQAS
jgi:signal transduction histidine kinase/HAMP domain-containing protein